MITTIKELNALPIGAIEIIDIEGIKCRICVKGDPELINCMDCVGKLIQKCNVIHCLPQEREDERDVAFIKF